VATTDYVIALTTLPADADASGLARTLVAERLAACVNILPEMTSIYRWQGEVEKESERQIILKTTRTTVSQLWARLRELHPYDIPEFVVLPIIDGNDLYLKWVRDSTTAR
jgi:periplasmic divalent cation tolerance protein